MEITPNSSLSSPRWKHHVFLSFRGEDTRFKFTDHLYQAFRRVGINAFRDEEGLRIGEEMPPAILNAIEESSISIIVFSRNYASSSWCLDELVKILECKKEKKQVVLPIFYEVDPSEIRHQTGSFEQAMARHEKKYKDNIQKVHKWRRALRKVANLSGESYKKEHESKFIDKIIQKISSILNHPLLHVPEQAIGLESQISQVLPLLSIGSNDVDVCMVGIYGTGGIGKTTIAKTIYNLVATQFECTSFCADVREIRIKYGLAHIQQTVLTNMLGDKDIRLSNIHQGIQVIRDRLQNKRVLLVLDDVENLREIQSLAGGFNWFGTGSRVIVTTRDKQLLSRHGIEKIYAVKELSDDEALELLCQNAFKSNQPRKGFKNVVTRVLNYARGIPLALEIIGSHLFGKNIEEWESAVDAYKKNMDKEIFGILRVSYDNLEYNEQEIFLDVACFYKGMSLDEIEEILGSCGFSTKYGLSVLEDRCLVKRQGGKLWMHDLTQRMGREILRRESEREPGERSRLWFHKDALQVLTRDTGTSKVEGILLELPRRKEVVWSGKAFKKMVNLRILIIHNAVFSKAPKELPNSLRVLVWDYYPSSSLPSNFSGNELRHWSLKYAPPTMQLQQPLKKFQNITNLEIVSCKGLKEVLDVSAAPSLTTLRLVCCHNLVKIHDSVGNLKKLKKLVVAHCSKLEEFPQFRSLNYLDTRGCGGLHLPYISKPLIDLCFGNACVDLLQCDTGSQFIQELMECHYSCYYLQVSRLPPCFRHRRNKNSISFWIRKTLPDVHIGLVIKDSRIAYMRCTVSLSVGTFEIKKEIMTMFTMPVLALITRFDLIFSGADHVKIRELLGSQNWLRVDIRMELSPAGTRRNQTSDAYVAECGVYGSRMCDAGVSFVNPYTLYSIKNKSLKGRSTENEQLLPTTFEHNDGFSSSDLLKKIMSLNVPPQVKHFAWTAILDYLPSKWTQKHKGICEERDRCGRCRMNMETVIHVLKKCQWARGVWLISSLGLRADRMKATDFCEWMQQLVNVLDTESLELFLVIAWGIWRERDKLCLGLKTEDPLSLLRRMCLILEEYRITHRSMSQDVQRDEEKASYRPSSQPLSKDISCRRKRKLFHLKYANCGIRDTRGSGSSSTI